MYVGISHPSVLLSALSLNTTEPTILVIMADGTDTSQRDGRIKNLKWKYKEAFPFTHALKG
jgi:hypothetical protein